MNRGSLLVPCILAALVATACAHDPGFHVATDHAPVWLQTDEGKRELRRALTAMCKALTSLDRQLKVDAALGPGEAALRELVKNDKVQALTHTIRVWAQNQAKPDAAKHLMRCAACNAFANTLLRNGKLKDLVAVKPKPANKLTVANALALIKKMNHKVAYGMTAESVDLNGDGYLDGVRLDNDGDGKFDTYQLDLDHDGFVDVIIEWDGKAWKAAKRR